MSDEEIIDDDSPVTRTILRKEFEEWRKKRMQEEEGKSVDSRSKIDALFREEQKRAKRRKITSIATLVTTILGGVSFGGYTLVLKPPPEKKVEPEDVKEEVTKKGEQLEHRVEANSEKVERLAEIAVEQQELTVKTADYIGLKIDAAHPRTKDAVSKPKVLDDAEEAVQERKRKAKAGELFKDIDDALERSEGSGG